MTKWAGIRIYPFRQCLQIKENPTVPISGRAVLRILQRGRGAVLRLFGLQGRQFFRQQIQNHAVGGQEKQTADGEFEQVIDQGDALPVCRHKSIAAGVKGNGEKYQRIQSVADDG